jgi:hypothetical protein
MTVMLPPLGRVGHTEKSTWTLSMLPGTDLIHSIHGSEGGKETLASPNTLLCYAGDSSLRKAAAYGFGFVRHNCLPKIIIN